MGKSTNGDKPTNPEGGSKPEVLVVDDEEPIRQLLETGLRQHDFTVWLAASGAEAVELYRQHRSTICLVLLDVQMPGLDGPGTLAELQRLDPHVRCCFLSGNTGKYTIGELRAMGAAHVLPKPFTLNELVQTLRKLRAVEG